MQREPYRAERVESLWDRIDRNRVKLAVFLGIFIVAWTVATEVLVVVPLTLIVFLFLGSSWPIEVSLAAGALPAFGGAVWWVWRSLSRSEPQLLRRLGAQRVPIGELHETKSVLHDMSIAVGLEYPPPLYTIDTTAVNAFMLGRSPEKLAMGVTGGMLKLIAAEEQRAVFANLMARYRDGETSLATVASALMSPVWAMRERDMRARDDELLNAVEVEAEEDVGSVDGLESPLLFLMPFYVLAVVVTEFLYYGQMEQHILTAEAADAKGMLLLKDPRCMLTALQDVLPEDNVVVRAGPAMAPLFFCWTGDAPVDADDPEYRRIGRLRETLGVEGRAEMADATPAGYVPPEAPRVGGAAPPAPAAEHAAEAPACAKTADENPAVLRDADAAPGPPERGPGSAEAGPDV